MSNPNELEAKFWKSLSSDRVMMIGTKETATHLIPMTAQIERDSAPIWFFSSTDTELVKELTEERAAIGTYAAKGHELFATIRGMLRVDNDPAVIERLWNKWIAAWYPGGRNDPKLALLRFDPTDAHIWLAETGLIAGVKLLFGVDPKKKFAGNEASVSFSQRKSANR